RSGAKAGSGAVAASEALPGRARLLPPQRQRTERALRNPLALRPSLPRRHAHVLPPRAEESKALMRRHRSAQRRNGSTVETGRRRPASAAKKPAKSKPVGRKTARKASSARPRGVK